MNRRLLGWWASARAMGVGGARALLGVWHHCVVCGHRVPAFLPWRGGSAAAPPLMRALHMVGSDLDHFACPRCGANDRDRHLRLYFERCGIAERLSGARILHFAPEAPLMAWIATMQPALHVLADLYPARQGIQRINLEAIPFKNGTFDVVIANHVLEHVGDLDSATSEIARVLAPGGIAILQTPWCRGLAATLDDPGVQSSDARLQLYGQEDHVRLFGRDVYARIGKSGLNALPMSHAAVLSGIDPDLYGVNPEEDLMLFARAAN
ncbi:class I SAM-dependent methyltransferase [Frateuria soli]|uniref:class I SAM-dependent methyltransferase n=1 Tax=Frateuria soli TaxID=1542730 RepID=UPI001E48259E|nr:class I SAM-dependent methyltransferase [Frateuria soli]UGB38983.1 methyltransferase domain-containing protein [Frateuria soli]